MTTSLENDSFDDPNIGGIGICLRCRRDKLITNAVDILVRPRDVRGDELGEHPGETFVMLTLTREEVRAMLHLLEEDWAMQIQYDGDPNEPNRRADWKRT